MFKIQDKKTNEDIAIPKKQKWVKKWEQHKHCSVCGISMEPEKEYCSSKCSGEYHEWKQKQDKKNKRNQWMMFIFMGLMIVMFLMISQFR